MTDQIAREWLAQHAETANNRDHAAHMAMISQNVKLYGVPDFDVIDYAGWSDQCRHEFSEDLFKRVSYNGLKMVATADRRVMFKTIERVEGTDGSINQHGLEIIVEQEDDGIWRVTQERILTDEETAHDDIASHTL